MEKKLSAIQRDCLQRFAGRVNKFGANFIVFDPDGQCLLYCRVPNFSSDVPQLSGYAKEAYQSKPDEIRKFGTHDEVLVLCLSDINETDVVAVIDTGSPQHTAPNGNDRLKQFARQYGIDYDALEQVTTAENQASDFICEMLAAFAEEFKIALRSTRQLEMVSTELTQTYEELILLHRMSAQMKVSKSNATYLQLACDQITQSVNVEGIAIFLEKTVDGITEYILTAGSGVLAIDQSRCSGIDVLQVRLTEELKNGKEALLDSPVDSPFKYEWPEMVKNIIAVPLYCSSKMIGIMVATNIIDKPDFDTIDVKLFNSVANQCAVFVENEQLFCDLKELFIGSLKALSNSIDAKDKYTRGHSERVAFISRWIAENLPEKMNITEEQVHKIYLAGLLHDIGKIGVNENVLCKEGKLTAGEIGLIKAHPRIGAGILADIKQMKDIIPGILCHHERFDGHGYPEALEGEDIPLIGRIIGIADAFDAMTSKRVYRNALTIKHAITEIEKGLGTQFDPEIGRIFLESDISKLWQIIQDGFIETWDYSNFAEYGTIAVGALIR